MKIATPVFRAMDQISLPKVEASIAIILWELIIDILKASCTLSSGAENPLGWSLWMSLPHHWAILMGTLMDSYNEKSELTLGENMIFKNIQRFLPYKSLLRTETISSKSLLNLRGSIAI